MNDDIQNPGILSSFYQGLIHFIRTRIHTLVQRFILFMFRRVQERGYYTFDALFTGLECKLALRYYYYGTTTLSSLQILLLYFYTNRHFAAYFQRWIPLPGCLQILFVKCCHQTLEKLVAHTSTNHLNSYQNVCSLLALAHQVVRVDSILLYFSLCTLFLSHSADWSICRWSCPCILPGRDPSYPVALPGVCFAFQGLAVQNDRCHWGSNVCCAVSFL